MCAIRTSDSETLLFDRCEVREKKTLICRSASAAAPEAFSRECGVCFTEEPGARAVLTACGHLTCAPCADTLADVRADGGGGRLVCPYCRANTGFVVLVEEEEEEEVHWFSSFLS